MNLCASEEELATTVTAGRDRRMNDQESPFILQSPLKKKNYSKIQVGSPVDKAQVRVLKKNVGELGGE